MSKENKKGFTIIELLTVMTIIIILMSVLVPGLNRVRIFAKTVTQNGQFHDISTALELYRNDHGGNLPESGPLDSNSTGYCGAMKLCEALLGQDGMGFHPSSSFQAQQPTTYIFNQYHCTQRDPSVAYNLVETANLQERIKYIDTESVKATPLQYLYTWDITVTNFCAPTGAFDNTSVDNFPNSVIGDVFLRAEIKPDPLGCSQRAGQRVGMPVLYYKADPSKLEHDTISDWTTCTYNNIYDFDDNFAITALGCPWESGIGVNPHPMFTDPRVFLKAITNKKVTTTQRPHKAEEYILLSAGYDGLYGTRDDVFSFSE